MNLIEFRAPDKAEKLGAIIEKHFSKHFKDQNASDFLSQGLAYVSDRPRKHAHFTVKPKSKIVLVGKLGREDSRVSGKDIVFENKQIVIWNKPSGLSTQGTLKKHEANLFDQVRLYYVLEKKFPGGLPYVGLHHRLDRDTSGLVLMTKQRSANKEVADLFKNRKIEKKYIAVCEYGDKVPQKKWRFKSLIKRGVTSKNPFVFSVDDKRGDEAITDFCLSSSLEKKHHIIECYPKTGRTHQLRVHLSHLGWPVLGDRVYGDKASAQRLMLHAQGLKFRFQGEDLDVSKAPVWKLPS